MSRAGSATVTAVADLDRAHRLYVLVGETAGFRRWMAAELEAGIGPQGRYP